MRCGICGKDGALRFLESHNEYKLYECPMCSGQFWDPMKNPGAEWYSHDERYANRNADPQLGLGGDHKWFLRRHPANGGRLLDIGMGTGNFLNAARRAGYACAGVDFDPDALDTARAVFGLSPVELGGIEEAKQKFGTEVFDVLTAFQVLEHVDSPHGFLTGMRELLKPGGCVALAMPYRGFVDWMKPGDKPPRHLSRWNQKSLAGALRRAGFEVVEVRTLSIPLWYLVKRFHFWTSGWLSFGLVGKLQNVERTVSSTPHVRPRNSKKVVLLKILALIKDYVLFSIPAALLFLWLWARREHKLDLVILGRKK